METDNQVKLKMVWKLILFENPCVDVNKNRVKIGYKLVNFNFKSIF